jgi:hypothetical protein
MVPGLRRFRRYYATARFMLIIGAAVAFALAALRFESDASVHLLQNIGWMLLCLTVLFIDPENPPNSHSVPIDEEPDNDSA